MNGDFRLFLAVTAALSWGRIGSRLPGTAAQRRVCCRIDKSTFRRPRRRKHAVLPMRLWTSGGHHAMAISTRRNAIKVR